MEPQMILNSQSNLMKKNEARSITSLVQNILQGYGNQNSMVRTQKIDIKNNETA